MIQVNDLLQRGDLTSLPREILEEILEIQQELLNRTKRNAFNKYFKSEGPTRRELYPKHIQFFDAGNLHKMRLFMAANRVGKTLAAAYEITCHVSGRYPEWWTGKKFIEPTDWWVCGKDSKTILEILQNTLLGPVGEFGTGMIPYNSLDFETLKEAKKADTGVSLFRIKHSSGNYSTISFKAYESGRQSFEGTARCIWLDEEPPLDVFTECLLRTATDDNILMMTFTPLKGISDTITNFLGGTSFVEGPVGIGKHVTMASWDDVPHLNERDKEILIASIPPWQRDSRTRGIPQLGSGAIYPIPETEITVDPFDIPKTWKRMYGMDVGWNRTAAIWFAQNPDSGTWYAYSEHYKGEAEPSIHAQSIHARGKWIPGAIDTAARGRSQIDGDNLWQMYKDLGLQINKADKSVETGLYTCWELLSTGQVKIFKTLKNFFDEYRVYQRDEKGKVVKQHDHLMDAFRYAMMSGRDIAKVELSTITRKGGGLPSQGSFA